MSAPHLHDLELVWPSLGPTDVIATGTFDQWSASIHLVKGDAGFSGTVKVPWGQKIAYKFIVDGHWRCREDRPQEDDGRGNVNNVFQTPEKPLLPAHDPPLRLSIPLDAAHGDGENMVTAVEFLTPAEPAPTKSLLLPIPHITVEGLTPVSESKLDTAAATEGHVSLASGTLAQPEPASLEQPPSSHDVSMLPTSDDGSFPLPLVNGNGEAHDSHSISMHPPTQSAKGELHTSVPSSETTKGTVSAPSESAAPEPNGSLQDTPVVTDPEAPPAPGVAPVPESTSSQPQRDLAETAAQRHRSQITSTAPVGAAPTSSTPTSSTMTHKKRRSLFARIKHMFEKDHNKQGEKERNKP